MAIERHALLESRGRGLKSIRALGIALGLVLAFLLAGSSRAQAADCMKALDCMNAAKWQRAIASDYYNKGLWYQGAARSDFGNAYTWNQKATFARAAGDANAAAWYQAIANSYAKSAAANSKAADDNFAAARYVNAAAQGNENRFAILGDVGASFPEGRQTVTASAARIYGCTGDPKPLKNERSIDAHDGELLFKYRIETRWTFCHGKITKLYPAEVFGSPSPNAGQIGWHLIGKEKIRANCYGGAPERCAWTYQFHWKWDRGGSFPAGYRDTCVTSQVRGDGAHYRHGGCDLKSWSGPSWGGKE